MHVLFSGKEGKMKLMGQKQVGCPMFGTTDVSAELLAPLSYDVIRGVLGVVCGGGRGSEA